MGLVPVSVDGIQVHCTLGEQNNGLRKCHRGIAHGTMDFQDAHSWLVDVLNEVSVQFHKVPGSAIFLRYVKSSYQNDPMRSAVELVLFLFFVRYLLAPKYSTQKRSYVKLSDEVRFPTYKLEGNLPRSKSVQEIDELVDDWTPEPLVATQTPFEEAEIEKRPVIVGYGSSRHKCLVLWTQLTILQTYRPQIKAFQRPNGHQSGFTELLQPYSERESEGEGDTDITNIRGWPLRASRLLRDTRCPHEDGGGHSFASRYSRLHRIRSSFLHDLERDTCIF